MANQTKPGRVETAATAKILLFDCESFPNEGLTWGTWDQKVIKVTRRRMICSVSWQWYPSREKHVLALCDLPGYDPKKRTNKALMEAFSEVIGQADIAVGHNIDEFDDKMVNTDFLLNRLHPAAPHRTIDTLRICRGRFRLNSNRLGDVCEELGIGKKLKHPGVEMWVGCMNGDRKSWAQMKAYNGHDVQPLLRGLYEHLRPWIINHPAMKPRGDFACPVCNSRRVISRGVRINRTGKVPRYQCRDCGKWAHGIWLAKKKAWVSA